MTNQATSIQPAKLPARLNANRIAMSPGEYRERWGLPSDYPMVAPNYAKQRSKVAKQIGLGKKLARRRRGGVNRPVHIKETSRSIDSIAFGKSHSLIPYLGCQRQLVEFCASLAPSRIVLSNQRKKALAVRGLDQVDHLMHDDVFEQVLGLLHELGV